MALFFSDPEHDGYSDEEMSEMLHDDDGDDDDDDDDDGDDMPEILASVPSVHSAVDDDDGDALANAEMMEDDMEMDDDEHDDGALEMRCRRVLLTSTWSKVRNRSLLPRPRGCLRPQNRLGRTVRASRAARIGAARESLLETSLTSPQMRSAERQARKRQALSQKEQANR